MAELDLEILYRPGEKNVVTDVLPRYGVDGVFESTANARFSMGDSSVRRWCMSGCLWLLNTWILTPVLQPLWRHYRDNYHFQRSRVASVELFMVIWVGMHIPYVLYIAVVCVVI